MTALLSLGHFKVILAIRETSALFGGKSYRTKAIMGTRRSSTLQNILSKYFFNDSSDNQCSPLTCADASDSHTTDVAASADPLDRSALIARLQTFQYVSILHNAGALPNIYTGRVSPATGALSLHYQPRYAGQVIGLQNHLKPPP